MRKTPNKFPLIFPAIAPCLCIAQALRRNLRHLFLKKQVKRWGAKHSPLSTKFAKNRLFNMHACNNDTYKEIAYVSTKSGAECK